MFRHSKDRVPVAIVAALTCVDFAMYFAVDSAALLVGYWLLMIIPKGMISAWNHHHQHSFTFRSTALNRLLELSYALHSGVSTHLWVLHHVFGHHLNYLDQTKDESGWTRRDGKQMGMLEYVLTVSGTAYYRAYKVGKRFPKHQRIFLTFATLTFALVALLVWHRPLQGLFLFALPMCCSLMYTVWVTYDHHAGLHTDDPFLGSYNIMNRWFNLLTGNLGYHTAHHYKQGVHWSELPALHETIKDRIPEHLYRKTTFDGFLPG